MPCYILRPVLQLLTFWEQSFVIFAGYPADRCSCLSRISIFKHFAFLLFYLFFFFCYQLLSSFDYFWLFLPKRCFLNCDCQSIFDCNNRTSSAHKSIDEIMIIIKRRLHKIPEVRVPRDQLMSPLIYRIFCFPFSLYHSSVRDKLKGKVCRWSRIHNF